MTSLVQVCDYFVAQLTLNKTALGLKEVWYGDQTRIGPSPVVCVEPDRKSRDWRGPTYRTEVLPSVYIIVYHAAINSTQSNRRDADKLAEDIETFIHSKPTLGGLVISGLVTSVESGYVTKRDSVYRSSRLTYSALSVEQLPLPS